MIDLKILFWAFPCSQPLFGAADFGLVTVSWEASIHFSGDGFWQPSGGCIYFKWTFKELRKSWRLNMIHPLNSCIRGWILVTWPLEHSCQGLDFCSLRCPKEKTGKINAIVLNLPVWGFHYNLVETSDKILNWHLLVCTAVFLIRKEEFQFTDTFSVSWKVFCFWQNSQKQRRVWLVFVLSGSNVVMPALLC